MPSGKEILDGIEYLRDGGPAAIVGLIVGYFLARPENCSPQIGSGECTNNLHQHIESLNGSPVSFEWVGPIIGCIIAFAIGGWLLGAAIRLSR